MTILEFLLLALLVGFVTILVVRREHAVRIAIFCSFAGLLVGIWATLLFDKTVPGFQFLSSHPVLPSYNLSLTFGADGISMVFLLLTLFIFPVCFLAT